ncbi:hypothetical protein HORIV_42030 [Vreelandella olivaria]|uniref:Uncharacterized protein n=1 Tax=Vreelandella olivaria TaxID=390919 RepID=A0ABM9SCW2_9GAMM|nr:hypothetical protein HORIV_42030 [Halomonas olivaria]
MQLNSGEWLTVGRAAWLASQQIALPAQAEDAALAFASQVMIADKAGWLATLYLIDQPVKDAEPSVKHLLASGYVVAMISGDRQGQ